MHFHKGKKNKPQFEPGQNMEKCQLIKSPTDHIKHFKVDRWMSGYKFNFLIFSHHN